MNSKNSKKTQRAGCSTCLHTPGPSLIPDYVLTPHPLLSMTGSCWWLLGTDAVTPSHLSLYIEPFCLHSQAEDYRKWLLNSLALLGSPNTQQLRKDWKINLHEETTISLCLTDDFLLELEHRLGLLTSFTTRKVSFNLHTI